MLYSMWTEVGWGKITHVNIKKKIKQLCYTEKRTKRKLLSKAIDYSQRIPHTEHKFVNTRTESQLVHVNYSPATFNLPPRMFKYNFLHLYRLVLLLPGGGYWKIT